jgi:hypothetical protein
VDEGVGAVDPVHQSRVVKEVLLDRWLPENVEALFEVNQLKGMVASRVNGSLNDHHCGESSPKLIYPVYESPIPALD